MSYFKKNLIMLFLITLTAVLCHAQTVSKKKSGSLKSRGLVNSYEKGDSDGISIRIFLETDQSIPVSANRIFKSGEKIRIEFQNNFDGYAYIVNVTPGGKKRVLFPHGSEVNNRIGANQVYSQSLTFDEEKGTETLQIIMSRAQIPALQAAINKPNGELNDAQSTAVAKSTDRQQKKAASRQGIDTLEPSEISASEDGPAIQSRGLTIVPGKRQGENLAIATSAGRTGIKIGKREARSFEIKLRHQ